MAAQHYFPNCETRQINIIFLIFSFIVFIKKISIDVKNFVFVFPNGSVYSEIIPTVLQ